jgi:hypothetical protein
MKTGKTSRLFFGKTPKILLEDISAGLMFIYVYRNGRMGSGRERF